MAAGASSARSASTCPASAAKTLSTTVSADTNSARARRESNGFSDGVTTTTNQSPGRANSPSRRACSTSSGSKWPVATRSGFPFPAASNRSAAACSAARIFVRVSNGLPSGKLLRYVCTCTGRKRRGIGRPLHRRLQKIVTLIAHLENGHSRAAVHHGALGLDLHNRLILAVPLRVDHQRHVATARTVHRFAEHLLACANQSRHGHSGLFEHALVSGSRHASHEHPRAKFPQRKRFGVTAAEVAHHQHQTSREVSLEGQTPI